MRRANARSSRAPYFWLWVATFSCVFTRVVLAETPAAGERVAVVRGASGPVSAHAADAVHAALLRNLASVAQINEPVVAPTDIDEIQLAVGCEGKSRSCIASIAQTLRADAIVIERIRADGGITTLELSYLRVTGTSDVASVQATVSAKQMVDAVPGLVRKLFGAAEPAAASAPPSPQSTAAEPTPTAPTTSSTQAEPASAEPALDAESAEPSDARDVHVRPLTWVALLAGAATLGVGLGIGASAGSSFEDFKKTPVQTAADAHNVHTDFESIKTRATIANVLMPVGGAVLALGGVLLYLDLSDSSSGEAQARLRVSPARDGLVLSLSGTFGAAR